MKKIVLKCAIEDERSKIRVMKALAGVEGVESVAFDMKERKVTVVGEADPVYLTAKVRKFGFAELVSIGPAKEEMKVAAIEDQGRNHDLVVQSMGLNRAIKGEGSKKRIMEAVAGFGDFTSIDVNVEQGMVTVVGNSVPTSVAMKIRELGYRAKLVTVGVDSEHK